MLPFNKILCPTDFSEASGKALEAASELALHFSAEVILVHVVHPLAVVPQATQFDVPLYQSEMETYARNRLQEIVEKGITGITFRKMVVPGDAANEIVNMAGRENADVIVIATHGETGWRKFMFGSVAEKVIRLAECPILVIHASPEEK